MEEKDFNELLSLIENDADCGRMPHQTFIKIDSALSWAKTILLSPTKSLPNEQLEEEMGLLKEEMFEIFGLGELRASAAGQIKDKVEEYINQRLNMLKEAVLEKEV